MFKTVTVIESSNDGREIFDELVSYNKNQKADIILLNEAPFGEWFLGEKEENQTIGNEKWMNGVKIHDEFLKTKLQLLYPSIVCGTRLTIDKDNKRRNTAFIAKPGENENQEYIVTNIKDKCYLPDEPGFYEASWYERSDKPNFPVVEILPNVKVGFAICSELWFLEHLREMGSQGVDIVFAPRCTGGSAKWVVGNSAAAVCSGAYVCASNRNHCGGHGLISDPIDGETIGKTTKTSPFHTARLNLTHTKNAKEIYPRYMKEY